MGSLLASLRQLAGSAAVVFVGTVAGRMLSLFGELLIIHSLTPERFGTVALAYTAVLTLSRVGLLGIPKGVARMESDETTDAAELDFLRSGYVLTLAVAACIAVGVYLFRDWIALLMGDPRLGNLSVLFVPFVLTFPLAAVSAAVLRARKESVGAVVSRDFGPRAGAIVVFAVFASLGRPFDGAVAYWVVTPVFGAAIAGLFLSRTLSIRSVVSGWPDTRTVRRLLRFSSPLAVSATLVTLMSSLDVLMVGYFLDSTNVGFYRSVQPLRQITQFVLQSFVFLFLPLATQFYARNELDELRDLYRVSTKWIALLTLPVVLVFSLFAPDIVRVFLRPEYLPASAALSVLTAGLFFNALVGPNGALIQAIDRPRIEMYAAVLGVLVNLTLNLVLIPMLGIVGAAIATVAGYVVFNAVEVAAIYLVVDTHPFSSNSLEPLVVTALLGGGVAWFLRGERWGFVSLVAIGMLFVVLEAVAVVATRSLGELDRQLLEHAKARLGIT